MTSLWVRLADKCVIILLQRPPAYPAFGGFSTLSMIQIDRHILAGVAIQAAIHTAPSIDKKFMLAHGDTSG
jgi:hypothetical protein